MEVTSVMEIGRSALTLVLLLGAPLLAMSLAVGLLVSLFQVATSLQDVTLTFVPKLVAVGLTVLLVGPWIIRSLVDYTRELLTGLGGLAG